jgi:signal transduction histidine kinase
MLAMQMLAETGQDVKEASVRSGHSGGAEPMRHQLDELLADVGECRLMMDSTIQTMTRVLEAERVRGGVTLRVRDVALRPLLKGLSRSAGRKSGVAADIRIDCPEGLRIRTDPDLLSTVLSNLVGNAVKYAGTTPILVRVDVRGRDRCRIEVCDQGPGISPEMLKHLFEQFHRAGRSDGEGMGLGLFIARRAAELLSARLDVESVPGHGCVFSIDLPTGAVADAS